jgi:hypothetical protein
MKMKDLSKRISALSPIKLELLAQRLGKECGLAPQGQVIPRRPKSDSLSPLSYAQERLWFLDQFERDKSIYNIPRTFLVTGPLDIQAMERSFGEIIKRHEALRTTFKDVNGVPAQIIGKVRPFKLALVDLSGLSPEEREYEVTRLVTEDALTSFDLAQGPLMRVSLLRLDDDEYVVRFTLHHIVSDGWSTGIFVKEWSALYQAFSQGRPSPLPEPPIQYADFAQWQRQWMEGRALEDHLSYWKRQLEGASTVLKLPIDNPQPDPHNCDGARQSLLLPRALTDSITAHAKRERVTLFTVLLTSLYVLLHYYSGQRDILVGAPAVNRSRRETEDLIGFFINTLVLRMDLSGDPTFSELLARARDVVFNAYAHQDAPFDKVVKILQPARSPEQMSLFQVAFLVHNAPIPPLEAHGVSIRSIEVGPIKVPYEMVVHAIDTEPGLLIAIEYKTNFFSPATISRVLAHYEAILSHMAERPESTLQEFKDTLAGFDERQKAETKQQLNEARLRTFMGKKRKVIGGGRPAAE